jgi:hypothetical protein
MRLHGCMVILALLALAATGCSPGSRVVGQWEVDTGQVAGESSGNPFGALAAGMMSLVQVGAEFKADGTCSVSSSLLGRQISKPGKWRYDRTEGNVLVLMIQMEGDSAEREVRVGFSDPDHLEMVPPGVTDNKLADRKLPFKRVKPS